MITIKIFGARHNPAFQECYQLNEISVNALHFSHHQEYGQSVV